MESSAPLSKPYQLLLTVLVLLLLVSVVHATRKALFTPLRNIPGPWYAKWTHLWLKWKVISGRRAHYIDQLHRAYGPYVRIAPSELSISDPMAFQTIYGAGSKFQKSEWYEKFTQSEGPHDTVGIFAMTDPKAHGERRKLFSHPFSNSSIMSKETTIRAKVNMAVEKFARDALRDGRADLMKWWTFLATDIVAALSFGQSFELLEKEKKTQYIQDLETAMMVTGIQAEFMGLFSILRYVPFKKIQDLLTIRRRIDSYGATAIQNHKESISKNPESSSSLLARFLDPTKHKSEISDYALAQEAGNLIVAGSDTTSVALTYLTWALLRPCNKHVRDMVMEEISSLPEDCPAKEILALPYLKRVIDETLRLYAGIGSLPRTVPRGGVSFGQKHFVPGGTIVSSQGYTLMRDPKNFNDAGIFNPDRWISPTPTMKNAYAPFLIGSRTCLGIHLAQFEIAVGIFTFLKKCPNAQIDSSMSDEDMEFDNYFLMVPRGHKLMLSLEKPKEG